MLNYNVGRCVTSRQFDIRILCGLFVMSEAHSDLKQRDHMMAGCSADDNDTRSGDVGSRADISRMHHNRARCGHQQCENFELLFS